MIYYGYDEVTAIYFGSIEISAVYIGNDLIWSKSSDFYSCFGKGYWINENPWLNDDGWKN